MTVTHIWFHLRYFWFIIVAAVIFHDWKIHVVKKIDRNFCTHCLSVCLIKTTKKPNRQRIFFNFLYLVCYECCAIFERADFKYTYLDSCCIQKGQQTLKFDSSGVHYNLVRALIVSRTENTLEVHLATEFLNIFPTIKWTKNGVKKWVRKNDRENERDAAVLSEWKQ